MALACLSATAAPTSCCACAGPGVLRAGGALWRVYQRGLTPLLQSARQGKGLTACIHAHTHLKAALAFAQQLREIWGFSLSVILSGYLC